MREQRLLHAGENLLAAFTSLRQRNLHDFLGDALNLDVHLQGGDTVFGTGDLEVHVAQVVFIAEDIGEHREAVAFLDQAHGDTGHVRLERHARIHHRQRAAAHGGHGTGTIGFHDFGDHTDGVAEFFAGRQHRRQRAFGQTAMPDFAALGAAHAPGLASRKRREVVVQQEFFAVFTGDGVDDLLVARSAQRRHGKRLRLAARKQRRTMRARQDADANVNRAHGARIAPVNARFTGQNAAAHDAGFQLVEQVVQLVAAIFFAVGGQRSKRGFAHFVDALHARLFRGDAEGFFQPRARQFVHAGDQRLVFHRRLPVPFRLARDGDQFVDGLNDGLHLLVTIDHRAQHDFFGQLARFRFHHQHGGLCTGHNEVQLAGLQLRGRRVQDVLTIAIAHARRPNRAIKRHAGNGQRRRGSNHRGNVGIHFGIEREHNRNHLHFVVETIGEERANRAVNQARDQRFFLGRTAFALEKAAGNAACGVELFDIINRQREKILTGLDILGRHHGGKHHRVVHIDKHRTARLAGNFSGFKGDGVRTVSECFLDGLWHDEFLSFSVSTINNDRRAGAASLCPALLQLHKSRSGTLPQGNVPPVCRYAIAAACGRNGAHRPFGQVFATGEVRENSGKAEPSAVIYADLGAQSACDRRPHCGLSGSPAACGDG